MTTLLDRFRGALLGLAAGDAVGTTLEFCRPGTFSPVVDMTGGGPFNLAPGQWTDDTSMALCLAESLLERDGFDARDQMERYVAWWRHGKFSPTGTCFDIGNTVRDALSRFGSTGEPLSGSTDPHSAGNGSLMRLAPVALFFYPDADRVEEMAARSSRTTHGAAEAVDACRYFSRLLVLALGGASKSDLLAFRMPALAPRIDAAVSRSREDVRGSGYVVDSLEAALWAFRRGDDFRSVVLAAANLGDDADTTAAIAGQIAGAHYGVSGIPDEWLAKLAMRDVIDAFARRMFVRASGLE